MNTAIELLRAIVSTTAEGRAGAILAAGKYIENYDRMVVLNAPNGVDIEYRKAGETFLAAAIGNGRAAVFPGEESLDGKSCLGYYRSFAEADAKVREFERDHAPGGWMSDEPACVAARAALAGME